MIDKYGNKRAVSYFMVTFIDPLGLHIRRALPDVDREIRRLVTSLRRNDNLVEWDKRFNS